MRREKENAEQDWKERLQSEKQSASSLVDEFKKKMNYSEETLQSSKNEYLLKESEFVKQIALLDQKISHYEMDLESLRKRERDLLEDIRL